MAAGVKAAKYGGEVTLLISHLQCCSFHTGSLLQASVSRGVTAFCKGVALSGALCRSGLAGAKCRGGGCTVPAS